MGSPLFNRQDEADIVESGYYKVKSGKQVRIGYPLQEDGTSAAGTGPVYTNYQYVKEYADVTSATRCIGVCEDQVPLDTGSKAEALENIEFRHIRRDVSFCQFGVRMMKNMESSTTLNTGDPVMPYPGGVKKWTTGKQYLGFVKRGPIKAGKLGYIGVNLINKA